MPQHTLIPQEQFQQFHAKERLEWAQLAGGRTVQLAFNYALAEMARLGYSQLEIKGASAFMLHVLNISEEVKPLAAQYPAQPLLDENDKDSNAT